MRRVVHFPALNLYVPLSDNEYFFDDGIVENLNQYVKDTCREYGGAHENLPKTVGLCLPLYKSEILIDLRPPSFKIRREKNIHIAYRNSSALTRGHEEAHALRYLGKLKWLFVAIGKKYGKLEMVKTMIKYLIKSLKSL